MSDQQDELRKNALHAIDTMVGKGWLLKSVTDLEQFLKNGGSTTDTLLLLLDVADKRGDDGLFTVLIIILEQDNPGKYISKFNNHYILLSSED